MEKEALEKEPLEKEPKENVWRIPFLKIMWSFLLTTITINFYSLQYILPVIGIALLLTGIHSLKEINESFHALWYLAIVRAVLFVVNLFVLSTPLSLYQTVNESLGFLSLIPQIAIYLVLRRSIRIVYQNHESQVKRDPLLWASILMVVIGITVWMPQDLGILIALIFFVSFLVTMRSFYKVSDELYAIAPDVLVKYSKPFDWKIHMMFILICCSVVGLACTVSNHTVTSYVDQAESNELVIREELVQLGFPKEILDDMSDSNVKMLTGAIHVEVHEEVLSFHKKASLNAYTVSTELSDNLLYVVIYFQWNQNKAIWNDGFSIWGEDGFELIDGNLLCVRNGKDVISPINRFSCDIVTSNSIFFGEQQSRQITGMVCFPFNSKDQRGYVLYRVQLPEDQWLGCNGMEYAHFDHPLHLPFAYGDQRLLSGTCEFKQHYALFYTKLYRDANPNSDDWKMPWD